MKLPRSRLIPAQGIALGSLLIESLSSLLNRIALKNFCSPRFLMGKVVNPEAGLGSTRNSFFARDGLSVLNGYRDHARLYCAALSELTGTTDLEQHTMIPFKALFDSMGKGIIHPEKRWCPECYVDAKRQSLPVYDPLIFSLKEVMGCPIHQVPLVSTCLDCGAAQQAVPSSRMIGWCTQCGGFLGYQGATNKEITHREQLFYDLFECRNKLFGVDIREAFKAGVQKVVERSGCGTVTKLTEAISFSDRTISQWVSGRYRPTLTSFLDFCDAVGVLPSQLLLNHQEVKPELGEARLTVRRSFDSSLEMEAIEKRLESFCISEEVTPLPEVARELEVGVSFLSYHFPELTRRLVQKNQSIRTSESEYRYDQFIREIKKIIAGLEKEGIVPSYNKVRNRLTSYHGFHYRDFTRLWGEAMKEWQAS